MMLRGWHIVLSAWQLIKTTLGRLVTSFCVPGHFPTGVQHGFYRIFYQFPGKRKKKKNKKPLLPQ